MKILYDLTATQPNVTGKIHGGGNYGIVVFFALLNKKANMVCFWDSTKFIRPDILEHCQNENIQLFDCSKKSIESIISENNIEIVYSAMPGELPMKGLKNVQFLGTLHGLRNVEMFPDSWAFRYKMQTKSFFKYLILTYANELYKKREIKKVSRVIHQSNYKFATVSNHSKYSILSYYPELKESDISVFYSPSTSVDYIGSVYSKNKYILMVSGNRSEKNVARAVKALDELFSERLESMKDIKVIITGANRNMIKIKIQNEKYFEFLGYVDEDTLNSLYKGAYLFIYPSINEGFGYPPLEAMHYGIPVIASPVTSISEICGDSVLYFNPFDYREIKSRILRVVTDNSCYMKLKTKSNERYRYIKEKQDSDLVRLCDWIMSGGKK